MSGHASEFSFTNGTGGRMPVVLEPDSLQFWIAPGSVLRIVVSGETPGPGFDLEFLGRALVVYLARGVQACVYQDGRQMQARDPNRGLWRWLNRGLDESAS
ncbi:hypothetical protein [Pseudomonas citronellolis]|uniref:hypothetical protein n=1 Tax=Pseudomonas citronellolis TaxID=53408 RepID=UPI0023E464C0|nr:hypothetical protein [Pseudomonas citronellolis]MDF3935719.1 hypothetical protein [Pseudomonas citronellolis]